MRFHLYLYCRCTEGDGAVPDATLLGDVVQVFILAPDSLVYLLLLVSIYPWKDRRDNFLAQKRPSERAVGWGAHTP